MPLYVGLDRNAEGHGQEASTDDVGRIVHTQIDSRIAEDEDEQGKYDCEEILPLAVFFKKEKQHNGQRRAVSGMGGDETIRTSAVFPSVFSFFSVNDVTPQIHCIT